MSDSTLQLILGFLAFASPTVSVWVSWKLSSKQRAQLHAETKKLLGGLHGKETSNPELQANQDGG